MTPEEFYQALNEAGYPLSDNQKKQYQDYYQLLIDWNQKMNLTAITNEKEVYLKHFFDSLYPFLLAKSFEEQPLSLCDVGAGAGFPSIPLKILFPQIRVTIVDSLQKRITFLTALAEKLNLKDVYFYHDRGETFGQNKQFRGQFDVVTARAVARLNILAELCLPLAKKSGCFLALKAAKAEEECREALPAIKILGGKLIEDKSYLLPIEGDQRHLIIIQKCKETPNKYPRKPGIPNKKPLL